MTVVASGERLQEIRADEIRSHLERVLSSPPFRSSRRGRRFLAYVVGEALEGKAGTLKERTLATEVFDRSASFDPGDDTIVRVGAREVRKRLAQYYASEEGMQQKVRIELPSGSYVPEFIVPEVTHQEPIAPSAEIAPPVPEKSRQAPRWAPMLAIIGIALAVAVLIQWSFGFAQKSAFDEFWAPIWQAREPVLIAIAHPLVYHPSSRAVRLNAERLGITTLPAQRALQLPPDELNGSDIVPVPDQYVGYGDTVAATQISVLLARHSADVRLHPGSRLEFGDFRETPATLIGAFTNRWTLEFTQNVRFHFGYDPHGAPAILDAANNAHFWSIPQKEDNGASPEDYFLVGRIINSLSGKPMIITAGLTQFGTEAAGRFVADSKRVDETLRKVGANWQRRNLEMVFHAKVIGNAPSASELIAWHIW